MAGEMNTIRQVHRSQRLRHITANKLTPALTVLRHLRDGESITPRLIDRAIHDLEAMMEWVDRKGKRVRRDSKTA